MVRDLWHYPRTSLAEQILGLFVSNLSSSFIFFAPRRMGKTEFLRKDIQPIAEKMGWNVMYFSFLDCDDKVQERFIVALSEFSEVIGACKNRLTHVKKVGAEVVGFKTEIEWYKNEQEITLHKIFSDLAKKKKILLLLDEVQVLTKYPNAHLFIASIRTALDMYKDQIKVIFTGSSREGLRQMFSQSDAPFFHFGQNIPFPELERGFIEHLSKIFHKATQRRLDTAELWNVFIEFEKVPQLMRSFVERLVLYPNLNMEEAKKQVLQDIMQDRAFIEQWNTISNLEQLLLKKIALGDDKLFSELQSQQIAKALGISKIPISSIQSALRVLQRKNYIGKLSKQGQYYIEDPNFKSWLLSS